MSEMEDTVHDLEQELAQRRDEASEAIAQWESHCSSLVARTEELEVELQAAAKEKDEVKLNMERSIVSFRSAFRRGISVPPLTRSLALPVGTTRRTAGGRKICSIETRKGKRSCFTGD